MENKQYNEDYYEHGLEKHLSCYSNYRWLPELTIPMAMSLVEGIPLLPHHTILDFGSAKGYLVKALRMLNRQAWGCDISEYAIDTCDEQVRQFCKHSNGQVVPFDHHFDWIISKDVFEHIPEVEIPFVLRALRGRGNHMLAIIPLGDGEQFTIPEYSLDVTHVTAQRSEWWIKQFYGAGWRVSEFKYLMPGVKDNWAHYPTGNGFFFLTTEI